MWCKYVQRTTYDICARISSSDIFSFAEAAMFAFTYCEPHERKAQW